MLQLQSQPSTFRSLYSPYPKPGNGAVVACQMLMILATKKAKPTYQLPKINAKNAESLCAAIIFCKSEHNAKSCCNVPNFTK